MRTVAKEYFKKSKQSLFYADSVVQAIFEFEAEPEISKLMSESNIETDAGIKACFEIVTYYLELYDAIRTRYEDLKTAIAITVDEKKLIHENFAIAMLICLKIEKEYLKKLSQLNPIRQNGLTLESINYYVNWSNKHLKTLDIDEIKLNEQIQVPSMAARANNPRALLSSEAARKIFKFEEIKGEEEGIELSDLKLQSRSKRPS